MQPGTSIIRTARAFGIGLVLGLGLNATASGHDIQDHRVYGSSSVRHGTADIGEAREHDAPAGVAGYQYRDRTYHAPGHHQPRRVPRHWRRPAPVPSHADDLCHRHGGRYHCHRIQDGIFYSIGLVPAHGHPGLAPGLPLRSAAHPMDMDLDSRGTR